MISQQVRIEGSGKGTSGWFAVRAADVSYDHPFRMPLEHALNPDFVNEALGPGARVAVELSAESARAGRGDPDRAGASGGGRLPGMSGLLRRSPQTTPTPSRALALFVVGRPAARLQAHSPAA